MFEIPEIIKTEAFWAPIAGITVLFLIGAVILINIITTQKNSQSAKEKNMEIIYRALKAKPTTLIIYCSDPRFQFAFNCFLVNDLDLVYGQFVPIIVAGGPAALANPAMAKEMQYINEQIVFFLKHFPSIKSVVLINHEDCGFYAEIPNPIGKKENRERDDTFIAAEAAAEHISSEGIYGVKVSAFYAKFVNADKSEIVFEKM